VYIDSVQAFSQALDIAGWERSDIDVVIHTGIVRGVAEPSAAAVYSNILGTTHAQTFDIVDACNSWIL
jgi:3-oxoacyl-[acyl-carrier-protein] synthase III